MKRVIQSTLLAVALVLGLASMLVAHEQKFMGTVDSIEGVHLQMTTTAGKPVMIMLDEKTKIRQGKVAKNAADIKAGVRVVVTTADGKDKDGKTMLVARQIMLGAGAPSGKK